MKKEVLIDYILVLTSLKHRLSDWKVGRWNSKKKDGIREPSFADIPLGNLDKQVRSILKLKLYGKESYVKGGLKRDGFYHEMALTELFPLKKNNKKDGSSLLRYLQWSKFIYITINDVKNIDSDNVNCPFFQFIPKHHLLDCNFVLLI